VLARKMAEKIVGRAVELDPSIMGEIAGQALAASRARGGAVVLRVHPDDLAAIEQTRAQWLQRIAASRKRARGGRRFGGAPRLRGRNPGRSPRCPIANSTRCS
jgi:hypothetical protein